MKTYSGPGQTLNYVTSGAVAAGDMIQVGTLLGIAKTAAAASGETIVLELEGVYALPKVDAAVIGVGETVTYDSSVSEIDDDAATPASGDLTLGCVAMETKGATTSDTILVKINVGVNTLT
jgi:predicted RecA/RadA family phage recombinase